ncbi:MAG: M48 family metalloprotease, partial [Bacteriovoracaceae bacterium]
MVMACPKSLSCGFEIQDVKAAEIQNGVPLYVEASSFDKNIWERLSKRAQKAKQKYGTLEGACPEIKARVQNVMDKIFKGSNLEYLQKGVNKLELILLCSQNKMPPVARIIAGKYLLVPASLPLKSHSEDAMAAVISHEIAHYTLRHHARLLQTTRAKNGVPTVSKKR